jgi:hypothetical protein
MPKVNFPVKLPVLAAKFIKNANDYVVFHQDCLDRGYAIYREVAVGDRIWAAYIVGSKDGVREIEVPDGMKPVQTPQGIQLVPAPDEEVAAAREVFEEEQAFAKAANNVDDDIGGEG